MPNNNKKVPSDKKDRAGSVSLDPDLSAGVICGTSGHMTAQVKVQASTTTRIIARQDAAIMERERKYGKSGGDLTPGEISML